MPMPMLIYGTEGKLKIPVPVYFIRHPQGTVLFDSGLSMRVQRDGAKALGPMEPLFPDRIRSERRGVGTPRRRLI